MSPRVAIIGAGPGGLTCARILLHQGFTDLIIFEGEANAHTRNQGGSLDLHPKTGQAALREAGIFDQFEKHVRYQGEDFLLKDKTGKTHVYVKDVDTGRPEIDRVNLRQILLDSVPEGVIRWGKRVKNVEIGKIEFTDGTEESGFELIIGADGAWSKTRHLVTYVPPYYSGISGFDITYNDVDTKHPEVAKLVGNGNCFIFGEDDRQALLFQRNGNGCVRGYAVSPKPESWIKDPGYDLTNEAEVKKTLLKEYAAWSPELKNIITGFSTSNGDILVGRSLYMLPVGLKWPTTKGVTLLGDAAGLMTPFAGEGVNKAMTDAMELANEILKTPNDLNAAVARYETGLFPRSEAVQDKTWKSLLARFGPGAIAEFKSRFTGHIKKMKEKGMTPEQIKERIDIAED